MTFDNDFDEADSAVTDSPLALTGPPEPDAHLIERLTATARTMPPGFAFSHATAAAVYGWPVPWAEEVVGDTHVITPTSGNRIRRPGIVGHRGVESRVVTTVAGLPFVAMGDTWVDLGELSVPGRTYSFSDLVICADQALNAGCSTGELRGIVESRTAPRGKRNLLPALEWARRGSESGGETRFRLSMRAAGLPEPALNRSIYDAAGRFLFRPDMSWRARRVAVEYQGAEVHDNPAAVAKDGTRFEIGERFGWTFIAVRSRHVWVRADRDEALCAIADALGFPRERLDLDAAEPQRFSASFATTLLENLERRRRRQRAVWLATR